MRVGKYLAILVIPYIILSCARADVIPVKILLGANEAQLTPSPVFDGKQVMAPLEILNLLGASYIGIDGHKVNVMATGGQSGEVNVAEIDGKPMIPMDSVMDLIGGERIWDENRHTLTLLAHLKSVEFTDDILKVNCSFPVSGSARIWNGKVILDLPGTKLASEANEVYIGTPLIQRARLGQFSETTARVVLDLNKKAGYKMLTSGKSSQIELQISENLPQSGSNSTAQDQAYSIDRIYVETVSDKAFDIVVKTTDRSNINASFGVAPPAVNLAFTGGKLEDSAREVEGTHPLLKSVDISSDKYPCINLQLARPMIYSIDIQNDMTTVHIRPPAKSGGTLAGKLIVIDPGHGGREKGAVSGGCCEKDINLRIAKTLVAALQEQGARTIITRSTDEVVGLAARSQVAIDNNADFFISIHCNSNSGNGSASGIETYYHMREPSPMALAYAVHAGVCQRTGMCDRHARSDRSLYASGLKVLKCLENTNIPGILLECGYVNNTSDRSKLLNSDYRRKLSQGIIAGLKAYIEGKSIEY